ncbi:MAG: nuclear transport factor 2 family protein [Pseudomonadota bacterium]
MRRLFAATLAASTLAATLLPAAAQEIDRTPEDVVYELFDAMRAGDGEAARDLIHDPATSPLNRMQKDGTFRQNTFQGWTDWIDTQEDGDADEQIFEVRTQVFGHLATVWAPFMLTYKGELRGCGVNMFTLGMIEGEWKIIAGIDTQADTPCETFESDYIAADSEDDKILFE